MAEQTPEENETKLVWFEEYMDRLNNHSVVVPPQTGLKYPCPCCGNKTLDERGGFCICPVCFWEDDGQDDEDADTIRGGPNGLLSLTEARAKYKSRIIRPGYLLSWGRLPTPEEMP